MDKEENKTHEDGNCDKKSKLLADISENNFSSNNAAETTGACAINNGGTICQANNEEQTQQQKSTARKYKKLVRQKESVNSSEWEDDHDGYFTI